MAAKLTAKQQKDLHAKAYAKQFNKIFELHKFLVECPITEHTVGNGDPVADAIRLIEKLMYRKNSTYTGTIDRLEKKIDHLTFANAWHPMTTAPLNDVNIFLKVPCENAIGWAASIGFYSASDTIVFKKGWHVSHHDVYFGRAESEPLDTTPMGWMRIPT